MPSNWGNTEICITQTSTTPSPNITIFTTVTPSPTPRVQGAANTQPAATATAQLTEQQRAEGYIIRDGKPYKLPQTGISALAWAGLGLLPLGWALKNFRKTKSEYNKSDYIWKSRQFEK